MKEITLKARVENIPQAIAFIDEALEALGCPLKAQMQMDVAMDELVCNVASYAYPDGEGDVTVQFDLETEEPYHAVAITLIDSGKPFNPLLAAEPDVTMPAEKRKIGGLGIFLVRKTMDAMDYEYRDGRNRLTFRKRI